MISHNWHLNQVPGLVSHATNIRAQRDRPFLEGFLDNRGLPVGLRVLKSPVIAFGNGQAGVHPEKQKYPVNHTLSNFLYPGDVAPSKILVHDIFFNDKLSKYTSHRNPIVYTACLYIVPLYIIENH